MNEKIKMDVKTARDALIGEHAALTFDQRVQLSIALSLNAIATLLDEMRSRR